MSKNLVLKGLSFVRKGQGGKPQSVDISGKASERAASFMASRSGKKGSKSKLKGSPHVPPESSVSHGRISKPAKARRSSGRKLQKEVARSYEPKKSVRDKNMEFFRLKQRRSRKILKNISQYVAENKSMVSRQRTVAPLLPPRIKRGKDSKAERRAQRQMQFSILRISDLGGSAV